MSAPDRERMEQAIAAFLDAAGLDRTSIHLQQTPQRVAAAWMDEFLDGYRRDPLAALGETYPAPPGRPGELVVVSNLSFRSACPHHLMPYRGTAHVAYVPGDRVVGFGKLGELLDALAHRLVLQEDLAREVAEAIQTGLGAQGAACALFANQACLQLRGEEQERAVTYADAYTGVLQTDASLRERFSRIIR